MNTHSHVYLNIFDDEYECCSDVAVSGKKRQRYDWKTRYV